MKTLAIAPYQETLGAGVCAPATLKMLLNFWNLPGAELTDIELAKHCGTDAVLGTSNEQFMRTAETFGLTCIYKEWSMLSDIETWLTRDIPVVVDWFSPGRKDAPDGDMPDGHYSIVVGLDTAHIYLQDPELGGMRIIPREQFMRVWFDYTGNAVEQPLEKNLQVRVSIAVYPKNHFPA